MSDEALTRYINTTNKIETDLNEKLSRRSYRGSPPPAPIPHVYTEILEHRKKIAIKMENELIKKEQERAFKEMFPEVQNIRIQHIITSHSGTLPGVHSSNTQPDSPLYHS